MKKAKTPQNKEHAKQQHCPTCIRYVKYNERYRDYVCDKCIKQAVDKDGNSIAFFNITESGHGVQGKYMEGEKLYRSTLCIIKGVKCNAEEAYFGGIVIRPVKKEKGSKTPSAKEVDKKGLSEA
ncbi:hypothetical protein [Mucilaginibacter sp.]|jgi:hypothetical protein|uniref:hypothetical protein n=1 Tax=Mucilaginibacter sp. TaxID=1882438 RepID=UPI002BCF75D4|nr:hypothetical protein [Mucilaginibacter sp.]HTI60385.1 hypothetical protein [Mucilaginibacter sp.]